MKKPLSRGTWLIALSFIIAFMLMAIPLPEWAQPWRPAWVAMVLVYWCIALPGRIGILSGWLAGLLLDVLIGTALGQHALGLAVIACIAVSYHKRLRVFSRVQQTAVIGALLFAYVTLMGIIDSLSGVPFTPVNYCSVAVSMLLWPWTFVVLRDVRRKGKVH